MRRISGPGVPDVPGAPHSQGNFTDKPVKLLLTVTPGGLEHFFRDRVELFKTRESDNPELQKRLEVLRRKYTQVIDYGWDVSRECAGESGLSRGQQGKGVQRGRD